MGLHLELPVSAVDNSKPPHASTAFREHSSTTSPLLQNPRHDEFCKPFADAASSGGCIPSASSPAIRPKTGQTFPQLQSHVQSEGGLLAKKVVLSLKLTAVIGRGAKRYAKHFDGWTIEDGD